MKSVPAIAAAVLTAVMAGTAFSQGQLLWGNASGTTSTGLRAPIYGVDPMDPFTPRTGNTATGIPAGTQTYGGPLLEGTGFTAAIFAGATPEGVRGEISAADTAAFRSGASAGFIVGPRLVYVPGTVPAQRVYLQMRAWDNRGGTVTSWALVLADPTVPHGSSEVILSTPLNPLGDLPPLFNTPDLRSFNLVVPEPSVFYLLLALALSYVGWMYVKAKRSGSRE